MFHSHIHCLPRPAVGLICLACLLLFSFRITVAAEESTNVKISGVFNPSTAQLTGTATFTMTDFPGGNLLFHLPPAWNSDHDERTAYVLRMESAQEQLVFRNRLKPLEPDNHENVHLAESIQILDLSINGISQDFEVRDNPKLPPLKNSRRALLTVSRKHVSVESLLRVRIQFKTQFRDMPSGFKRILWDFAPRPVGRRHGAWDFKDVTPPSMQQSIEIRSLRQTVSEPARRESTCSSPFTFFLLDSWNFDSDQLQLSYDRFFEKSKKNLMFRIYHVLTFLEGKGLLLNQKEALKLVLWDGDLTISGLTVLLPRRLFRYPSIFNKQFEIVLLKGISAALIHSRFQIDTDMDPWIVPAILGEMIRCYFTEHFKGDTRIFPWLDWINPHYFADTTVRKWVEKRNQKIVIAADAPSDSAYFAHHYHPAYEKGFHLLPVMHDGLKDYQRRQQDRIFTLLAESPGNRELLDKETFFRLFAESDRARDLGRRWLSETGRIDYAIHDVSLLPKTGGWMVQLAVINRGTVSPVTEAVFYFDGGEPQVRLITPGDGVHEFFFAQKPEQIILDPDFQLLDDNPVNNRWHYPVRTRLFYDFDAPDNWLITFSPLIGQANTFDRNILGLNLTFSYLTQTGLRLNLWKGSSEDLLWTGEFSQNGYPFKGSNLYLKTGYLGAVSSTAIGMKQENFSAFPDLWVDVSFWKERLDHFEESDFTEKQLDWTGITITSEFPLVEIALHSWDINIMARSGNGQFQPEAHYHQLRANQTARYRIGSGDLHLGLNEAVTSGSAPLQRQFAMGGTEGLSGFPRSKELLYEHRRIIIAGTTLPGLFTNTDLHVLGLMWLQRIVPTFNVRCGIGQSNGEDTESFADAELGFTIHTSFINRFQGQGRFAIAQPLGHDKYKDYRIVLFSDWVF